MPFTGLERWDAYPEQTAVTSNPAAGTLSVDVKTFTGRGRVSYMLGTCLADATVATRTFVAQKVSGANTVTLCQGVGFAASTSGSLSACRGIGVSNLGLTTVAIPDIEFAPGDILRVAIAGGQAGDDLSAITYSFKEML